MNGEAMQMRPRLESAEHWLRCLCLAAALVASLPGLRLLSWIWSRSEYLAHGYLIPFVSLGLLYARRGAIAQALREGGVPRWGPLWVGLAAVFESIAVGGEISSAAGVGVPLLLLATAYAVAGGPLLRTAALPVGFLVLMVPPPRFVYEPLLLGLKGVVIQSSVAALQALGQPVAALGNQILVPGHQLFVEDACSGLTSVITLLPLAVVVAHFLSRGVWRRAVIIGAIVPLAMLGNIARVSGTALLVSRWGIEYAGGALHESFGLLTALLGAACLGLLARRLA